MSISTHVLDTALGRPAAGIPVSLSSQDGDDWTLIRQASTDADGRIPSLLPEQNHAELALFRLRFETAQYFAAHHQKGLYPYVDIVFKVERDAHYHIPLLLTANGYTTYRGS
jgi:5-hydroxyisourate hydrolase